MRQFILLTTVVPSINSYLPEGSTRYAVNETNNITFQCTATGVPPPDIQWYRGSDILNSSSDSRVIIRNEIMNEQNGALAYVSKKLILTNTSISDAGCYSCNATNSAINGETSAEFELLIQSKNLCLIC